MLKIGLTGGIGSGKSTVAKIFEQFGIPVYYADQAARDLMNSDKDLRKKLILNFGENVYKQGQLDRSYLSSLVFRDPQKLSLLNSIVHPITLRHAGEWMSRQKTVYAIKEAALIFEAGVDKFLDYVIGVSAPETIRIQRVMDRDNTGAEMVKQRINQQMDETEKMKRCDFIIVNDNVHAILPQVQTIHQELLNTSGKSLLK